MALNAPIQGTAADIVKVAMLQVDRALAQAGLIRGCCSRCMTKSCWRSRPVSAARWRRSSAGRWRPRTTARPAGRVGGRGRGLGVGGALTYSGAGPGAEETVKGSRWAVWGCRESGPGIPWVAATPAPARARRYGRESRRARRYGSPVQCRTPCRPSQPCPLSPGALPTSSRSHTKIAVPGSGCPAAGTSRPTPWCSTRATPARPGRPAGSRRPPRPAPGRRASGGARRRRPGPRSSCSTYGVRSK